MNGDHKNDRDGIPRALGQLRDRFERWREQNGPGCRRRIPKEFWEGASVLARGHGVFKVARTLRLDYATLKQRAGVHGHRPPRPRTSPFVELVMPDARAMSDNLIELVNRQGARMTLRLHAPGSQTLRELTEVFLRARK
jgi:hypothetical protein